MILERDFCWIAKRLELHEGLRLSPYICPAGKKTIGVGRNLEDNPLTPQERRACGDYEHGITRNAAMYLLKNDVERCINQLKNLDCWYGLDVERQYALLDMCFQLGFSGLKKFRKMLKAFTIRDFKLASFHCLDSAYAQQTPNRARKIAKLIREGVWRV